MKQNYCLTWARTEQGRAVRRRLRDKGVKYRYKAAQPRTDRATNTLTGALKDNMIMTTETEYGEIDLRPDSVVEPLGDCRFRIDGRTIRFAIRKLTPRECFRLMGVDDRDIDTMQAAGLSNSAQYKLAGNSIVVDNLYHIFRTMFIDTGGDRPAGGELSLF